MAMNDQLVQGVKTFLDGGDRSFLDTMRSMDREDLEGKAVIRYLLQLKHWPLTPDGDFSGLLEHFFGHHADRVTMDAQNYRDATKAMILEAFAYECVEVIPEPKAEKPAAKPNPGKRTSKPRMQSEADSVEEGESGSRTFKSIRDQENA